MPLLRSPISRARRRRRGQLPCAHGPSRAASLMIPLMLPYVREANERTTSWITRPGALEKWHGNRKRGPKKGTLTWSECGGKVDWGPQAQALFLKQRSEGNVDRGGAARHCQTLPGLPRAARPSGRFAEGKTPQSWRGRIYFGLNMRQARFIV